MSRKDLQLSHTQAAAIFQGDKVDGRFDGPAVALVLSKPGAIQSWLHLMGPSLPAEARQFEPDSLRARYGDGVCLGSEDQDGAVTRDLLVLFPELARMCPNAVLQRTVVVLPLLFFSCYFYRPTRPTHEFFTYPLCIADQTGFHISFSDHSS